MIAAYVGYKLAGLAGAAVAATAALFPSFIIMLAILPVLERVRKLAWVRAVMRGMAPAVIGVLAVSLIRLAPAALPDPFAVVILAATLIALVSFPLGAFKLMIGGALLGVRRSRLPVLPGDSGRRHTLSPGPRAEPPAKGDHRDDSTDAGIPAGPARPGHPRELANGTVQPLGVPGCARADTLGGHPERSRSGPRASIGSDRSGNAVHRSPAGDDRCRSMSSWTR
jgi:chromate transport protein ChrA